MKQRRSAMSKRVSLRKTKAKMGKLLRCREISLRCAIRTAAYITLARRRTSIRTAKWSITKARGKRRETIKRVLRCRDFRSLEHVITRRSHPAPRWIAPRSLARQKVLPRRREDFPTVSKLSKQLPSKREKKSTKCTLPALA